MKCEKCGAPLCILCDVNGCPWCADYEELTKDEEE